MKGLEDTDGDTTIVVDVEVVDVSAACKGAPTLAVATLTNTTTHSKTRILFIPKPATTNKPAGTAELLVIGWGTYLST
jgi:hypothetical protein